PIETALNNLKEAYKNKDFTAIDSATNELNTVFQAASQEMYNASNAQAGPQGDEAQASQQKGPKGDGEVTDVDFEEVK
ncbi:MAG: molecular chaperone DnaK, partial [Bacteroidetes bacterium]|nr:molecular chaperone DnaK [Bacteroidota bacterium]